MEWLISKINQQFENKFSFLKLQSVVYSAAKKQCCVTLLYPESANVSQDEKQSLESFVKSLLPLSAEVVVKIKKSYLDSNLILDAMFEFWKTSFPAIWGFVDKTSAKIEKNFQETKISIKIDKTFLNFLSENDLKISTKRNLEKQFITEISLEIEKAEIAKDVVLSSKLPVKKSVPRFDVEISRNLFGGEISPHPEFIKNIKTQKTSVILAGKIENFEKKSYEIKKGKRQGQRKNYYAFLLNDTTSKIEVRYFSTLTNEKHMDKLTNDDEVLILGDVEEFNRKLTLYVKAIARVRLPQKIEFKQPFSSEYEVVEIQPYSILSQENLFKKPVSYNPFVERGSFVVFDVETTGLNYETDELLEIGAVKIEKGQIVSKFSSLIKPRNPIPSSATMINNITNEMVEKSPNAGQVVRDFYRFTRGCALVGYNVGFDQKFVVQEAKKQNLVFDNEFVDLLPIARNKLRLSRYKLGDVVKRLEITLDGAHRAYADALATAEAFLKLNSSEYA